VADVLGAAHAALNYLDDECEDRWSKEQAAVVRDLRAALKGERRKDLRFFHRDR